MNARGPLPKAAAGRINSSKLFAFNKDKKDDALRERGYWERNKDTHPINRFMYRRWEKNMEQETIFRDKASKLPVDQQFKMKKLLSVNNLSFWIPLAMVGYFVFCYLRYQQWGTTPTSSSFGMARLVQNLSKPPGM